MRETGLRWERNKTQGATYNMCDEDIAKGHEREVRENRMGREMDRDEQLHKDQGRGEARTLQYNGDYTRRNI